MPPRGTGIQTARYGDLMQALPSHVAAFTKAGVTSEVAAREIAKAVTARKPRTRYTIGVTTAFNGLTTAPSACETE